MSEILQALSPWSEIDESIICGLSKRLDTLDGKTIGLFGDFMIISTYMLRSVETCLQKKYPAARFKFIQYKAENINLALDDSFRPVFDEWAKDVDCVLVFYGTVPSSSLFLGYNAAYMEKCGIPTVVLVAPRTLPAGQRGVKAFGVPDLRLVAYDIKADKVNAHVDQDLIDKAMEADIEDLCEKLVSALTTPLTEEEAHPSSPDQKYARTIYEGTAREISNKFYKYGFTNGQPIEIPTPDAVDEMLTGTDLSPDTVIGRIPPKMGLATVKCIAVNAVMAGCLPTHLPVLIAAVKAALADNIILEGWTCSQSTWGPVVNISGPITKDINLNTKDNALSPYYKANACIGRAFGYIMMNIAGLRPGIEDLSEMGHENRLGLTLGDSIDNNPWGPVHMKWGFDKNDSCVTMFWPQEHYCFTGRDPGDFLDHLCSIDSIGWEPGLEIILTPLCAKIFADAGWTKERIEQYIVEYARKPASKVDIQWFIGNNHLPPTADLPLKPWHSTRVFWNTEHMLTMVAGGKAGPMMTVYSGGGDHGGPACVKIELPEHWNDLVEKYRDIHPEYISY